MNLLKVFFFFLEKQLTDNMTVSLTANPTFNEEDYRVRREAINETDNYSLCEYDEEYSKRVMTTLKVVILSVTYYLFFTMKEVKYTKEPIPSSVIIARRSDKIYIERKLKLDLFVDEEDLFNYIYDTIIVNKLDLSADNTTLLETK